MSKFREFRVSFDVIIADATETPGEVEYALEGEVAEMLATLGMFLDPDTFGLEEVQYTTRDRR